jgi:hypothetical protein
MERGTIKIVNEAGFGFFEDANGRRVHFRFDRGEQRRVLRSWDGERLFFEGPAREPVAIGDEVLFVRQPGRRDCDADHAVTWGKVPEVIPAKEAVRQLRIANAVVVAA